MRQPPPRLLIFAAALLAACLQARSTAFAQSLPPLSGVTVSLSTSATRVVAGPNARGKRGETLAAQITLRNRGRAPLSFEFPDVESARSKFTFSLFDETDTLVWSGAAHVPVRASNTSGVSSTTLTLAPRAAWHGTALIPLVLNETWLPPGVYRVEAALAGTPATFAAANFEIVAPTAPLTSGIDGLVLLQDPASNLLPAPAPDALVRIESLVRPNVSSAAILPAIPFQGRTDSEGRFSASLPPGDYLVKASSGPTVTGVGATSGVSGSERPDVDVSPGLTGSAIVKVLPNERASVTINLSSGKPPGPDTPGVLASGVNSVSAAVITDAEGVKRLRVTASGWVPHPGYANARLVATPVLSLAPLVGGTLRLDLRVTAPPPGGLYPMVIAQVSATAEFPLDGQNSVIVRAASNSMSATVSEEGSGPSASRFPAHWGPPPAIQTTDLGELPGGYGVGSSTLAQWILQNMARDASGAANQ
jgi:hypothetical protein